jgi:shikimate kinase
MPDNIYLIGMMGSGKTATGKCLAEKLGWKFLDLDSEIEKKEGITIPQIFATLGEPAFREREHAALKKASGSEHYAVSTGGGIVCREKNITLLRSSGKVFYLRASPEILFERVRGDRNRPLLQTEDPLSRLKQLLDERTPNYRKAAHVTVDTEGKTPGQVAQEIYLCLKGER